MARQGNTRELPDSLSGLIGGWQTCQPLFQSVIPKTEFEG